jgi:hypothetical protein
MKPCKHLNSGQNTVRHPVNNQSGSVMLVALVMLVIIGTLGLLSIKTSKLETRMAGNEQVRIAAHQTAQSLIDVVIADSNLTPVVGDIGYMSCTGGQAGCNAAVLLMPVGTTANEVAAGYLSGTSTYTAVGPPPRVFNTSSESYVANHYRIRAQFDRADEGLGTSDITQGIVILTPSIN